MLSQRRVFELCGQFAALHDGALDEADARTLEQLLRTDREVRRLYVRYMRLCAGLAWDIQGAPVVDAGEYGGEEKSCEDSCRPCSLDVTGADVCPSFAPRSEHCEPPLLPAVAESSPVGDSPRRRRAGGHRWSSWRAVKSIAASRLRSAIRRAKKKVGASSPIAQTRFNAALACIASLLFAAAVAGTGAIISAILMRHSPPAEQPPSEITAGANAPLPPGDGLRVRAVARLARTVDCLWAGESSGAKLGEGLAAGRKLMLKSGLAEIVFDSGAETVLEGPATLEIRSRASIALNRGKCAVTAEKPSARGFEIAAPGMKYTDLGTEFGVLVAQSGEQEVHVFRGKVQAEQSNDREKARKGEREKSPSPRLPVSPSPPLVLTAHEAIRVAAPVVGEKAGTAWTGQGVKPIQRIAADDKQFVRTGQLEHIAAQSPAASSSWLALRRWKRFSEELCKRPDLVAYYDFQPDPVKQGETGNPRVLRNRAATGQQYDGQLVGGAQWVDGRLPGKKALLFHQPGSGVRVNIPVDCKQLTLLAWAELDALPNPHLRAILTSDTWHERPGSVHWQLRPGATFDLDVSTATGESAKPWTSVFRFPGAANQWGMFAETYDADALRGCAYFNANLVGKETLKNPSAARIDRATIGNRNAQAPDEKGVDRTFSGQIDELMIFRAVLSAEEIARIREGLGAGN